LWTWYLHGAVNAAQALPRRHRVDPAAVAAGLQPLSFTAHEQALEWYEAERVNLVTTITSAADAGRDDTAWQLALALGSFFNLRKYWTDWIHTHRAGLTAAERIGNATGQAWLLTGLGSAYRDIGDTDSAIDAQRRAAELFAQIGDREGIASSSNNLGSTLRSKGDLAHALTEFATAIATYRETGDTQSQGRAMSNHATVLCDLGRCDDAIAQLNEALTLLEASEDRHGEGFTLHNLGDAYTAAGRLEEAISVYLRALDIRRATGNVWGEARTLRSMGICHERLGAGEQAVEDLRGAVACYAQTSDRNGHAQVLDLLAKALRSTGEITAARQCWGEALVILDGNEDSLAGNIRAALTAIENN
jgi:tetratricopeptide (TPR) repeat protein